MDACRRRARHPRISQRILCRYKKRSQYVTTSAGGNEVVRQQSIFRIILMQHQARLLQVVLRQTLVQQVYLEESWTADLDCRQRLDTENELHPLRLLSQILILTNPETGIVRLEIRIHHAHYDAFSMNNILQDISAAYKNGHVPSARPHFHDWISYQKALNKVGARDFCTKTLHGSIPTQLSSTHRPLSTLSSQSRVVQEASVEFFVSIQCLQASSGEATQANVLKAALATVLSHAAGGLDDVVLGEVQASRTSGFPNEDTVCGPTLNVLPFRVKLSNGMDSDLRTHSMSSLISRVQAQSIRATPYQHLAIRSIIKGCTDWPVLDRFSSIVMFQNHEASSASCAIGDVECEMEQISYNGNGAEMWVVAMPGPEQAAIQLMYATERFSATQVEWLARCLKSVLAASAEAETLGEIQRALQELGTMESSMPSSVESPGPNDDAITISSRSWKVVQDAWRDVGLGSADPGTGLQANAADYDVVMALLLSEHFRSRVYEVSTADITTHSAQEQKARLIEK